ncbi:MAG: hypothetical protein HZA36_01190 [Parcubacteria group bacterium]|nr:hypothetical protein [Parcubacteria group bacterium]
MPMSAYEELVYTFLQELEINKPREDIRRISAKLIPFYDKMYEIFSAITKKYAQIIIKKYGLSHIEQLNTNDLEELLECITRKIHKHKEFQRNLSLFISHIKKHLGISVHLLLHISLEPEEDETEKDVSYSLAWYMFLKLRDKEGIDQTPTLEDFRKVIPRYLKTNFNIKP